MIEFWMTLGWGKPRDLEAQIAAFVDDYNHRRYHESIDNLTPANVYFGRGPTILAERQIKRKPLPTVVCNIDCRLPEIITPMSQSLP